LVDRIVSGFPKKTREQVFEELGYQDELVVEAEWFHLWVIEGPRWMSELLPFKKAGFNVIITNDLSPYRARKVRILNGAHTSMAIIGSAVGLQTVRNALDHPILGKFIRRLIYEEIVPHISGDILELEKYADEVITRFRNPAIEHKLEHIAQHSFSKYKVRVLPSIIDNLERHGDIPERLAFTFASMIYFYRGHGEGGKFNVVDSPDIIKLLKEEWELSEVSEEGMEQLVRRVLLNPYWEVSFNKYPHFIKKVSRILLLIESNGLMETLQEIK
jgi:tagaturonate reductase